MNGPSFLGTINADCRGLDHANSEFSSDPRTRAGACSPALTVLSPRSGSPEIIIAHRRSVSLCLLSQGTSSSDPTEGGKEEPRDLTVCVSRDK